MSFNQLLQTSICYNVAAEYAFNCAVASPANGQVSIDGVTATYTCDTGYSLVGSRTRTCGPSGNWSTAAPTCQCIAEYSVCAYIVISNSFSY